MSIIAQSLDSPFERLSLLPTTMNWLGSWTTNTLYLKNSVVISPADNAIYILTGATSLVNNVDPSLSPMWDEVLPTTATGVLSVSGSAYINVDNTDPQNPIVNNTGVLLLRAQNGLQAQGTTKNPLIVNTGVLRVSAGLGIGISGNTVSNTGILGLSAGTGIQIPTGFTTQPTVINNGVVSVVAGYGIRVSDLPTERAGSAPFITLSAPQTTPFINSNDVISSQSISFNDFATIPIPNGNNPASILFQYINGTPPDPTGLFLFDFSGWSFILEPAGTFGLPSTGHNFTFTFYDSTTQKTFTPTWDRCVSLITAVAPFYLNIPQLLVPIQAIKAAGLTRITDFVVSNGYFPNGAINYVVNLQSSAATYATYYPANLV
jgi:hypothetical protein